MVSQLLKAIALARKLYFWCFFWNVINIIMNLSTSIVSKLVEEPKKNSTKIFGLAKLLLMSQASKTFYF
jgi:hypothetical protein